MTVQVTHKYDNQEILCGQRRESLRMKLHVCNAFVNFVLVTVLDLHIPLSVCLMHTNLQLHIIL